VTARRNAVLVVEDNDDLRHLFRDRLKSAGFVVHEASDGMRALRLIEDAPPDLVVLDIGLPMLDGISVRDELAAHVETRDIPIVIVTGTVDDVGRIKAARVLRKPVDLDELVAAVRALLPPGSGRRLGLGREDT
jgi:DNA-binding response OmpR family regulator